MPQNHEAILTPSETFQIEVEYDASRNHVQVDKSFCSVDEPACFLDAHKLNSPPPPTGRYMLTVEENPSGDCVASNRYEGCYVGAYPYGRGWTNVYCFLPKRFAGKRIYIRRQPLPAKHS